MQARRFSDARVPLGTTTKPLVGDAVSLEQRVACFEPLELALHLKDLVLQHVLVDKPRVRVGRDSRWRSSAAAAAGRRLRLELHEGATTAERDIVDAGRGEQTKYVAKLLGLAHEIGCMPDMLWLVRVLVTTDLWFKKFEGSFALRLTR